MEFGKKKILKLIYLIFLDWTFLNLLAQHRVIYKQQKYYIFFLRNQVDLSRPIRLDFPDWLGALQIALKYKTELKRDHVKSRTTSESSDTSTSGGTASKIVSAGVEAIAGIEVENVRANFRGLLLNTIEGASRVLGASGSSSSNKTVAKRMLYR